MGLNVPDMTLDQLNKGLRMARAAAIALFVFVTSLVAFAAAADAPVRIGPVHIVLGGVGLLAYVAAVALLVLEACRKPARRSDLIALKQRTVNSTRLLIMVAAGGMVSSVLLALQQRF